MFVIVLFCQRQFEVTASVVSFNSFLYIYIHILFSFFSIADCFDGYMTLVLYIIRSSTSTSTAYRVVCVSVYKIIYTTVFDGSFLSF